MGRVREVCWLWWWVWIGAVDVSLTSVLGVVVVTGLVDRLVMIELLDLVIGSIKVRGCGFAGGELLVGVVAVRLVGEGFLVGLDRQGADVAG